MTLKDKLNVLAQKAAALRQAQADVEVAANALVVVSGPDDQVIYENHSVILADEQAVITIRNGVIDKTPIQQLT